MKVYKLLFRSISLVFLLLTTMGMSCKKGSEGGAPCDLELAVNGFKDGSGRVDFIATANNADRYFFSFGQGNESIRSNDGKVSTVYKASVVYNVKVIAYSSANKSIELAQNVSVSIDDAIEDVGYVSPEDYPGMSLVWQDEFDGNSLNTKFWSFDIGTGVDGWGNHELQYYREENVEVQNGYLTITAKKEAYSGKQYTSSRIKTEGKKSFLYGRIDMRAKLPKGQGIWPAFWALGANHNTVGWPLCGEIDFMEMVGGGPGKDNTVHGTVHYEHGGHQYVGGSHTLTSGDFYDKFHVFSIVWTANKLTWYVDNEEYYSFDTTDEHKDEFRRPYFILLNMAVGGIWPGSPDVNTVFPQKYIIDYVRVFQ